MFQMQRFRVGFLLAALLSFPLLPVGMSACSTTMSDRAVARINTTDAARRHGDKSALFIDARPEAAYNRGHIPGAINIRLGELSYTDRDARLLGRSPLIVYGENPSSATALALAKRMMDLEYENIIYYEPGFTGWRSAGLPIERAGD